MANKQIYNEDTDLITHMDPILNVSACSNPPSWSWSICSLQAVEKVKFLLGLSDEIPWRAEQNGR